MNEKNIQGKITFIHHDKNRAVIEYIDKGKKKTIQANLDLNQQQKEKDQKIRKKMHRFLIGDQVTFVIKKTGANGSALYAENLKYHYNTGLELLINKANAENKFLGYIKITDENYFIKEIESYLFFPLSLSAYEIAPTENETAEPVYFKLENLDKPDKISARLYNHKYIPEFLSAVQSFKKQAVIEATIYNITSFGIYLNLIGEKIKAKLPMNEVLKEKIEQGTLKIHTLVRVKIKHISSERIVVDTAGDD
jgi:ribosomal protein S1